MEGTTGVPLVDAVVREIKETGYASNQARMIAANFFTTSMRMDWRLGAAFYERYLVDYDAASNWVNWLIAANLLNANNKDLNPIALGMQLDPEGEYIKRWVPELSGLHNRYVHRPWEAPEEVLRKSGVYIDARFLRVLPKVLST